MQREQILYELQRLFWPARAKLIIYATDSLLTFHVSSLHPLNKRASILQLYLFHCLSFSIFSHGFERRRTCLCCYMCAPFSSHKFMHLFTFALPFFLLPFFHSFLFLQHFLFILSLRALWSSPSTFFFRALQYMRLSACLFQFSFVLIFAQPQASYDSFTSLLPQGSCYYAYFVHFRMVSS